jgi:hypothetical protein
LCHFFMTKPRYRYAYTRKDRYGTGTVYFFGQLKNSGGSGADNLYQ